MDFVKIHGLGNDFILFPHNISSIPCSKLASFLCNRHLGIGADGVILLLPPKEEVQRIRIFNADGSEAETCGNGVRCVAKYLREKGIVTKDEFVIATPFRNHSVLCRTVDKKVLSVTVGMGQPQWGELAKVQRNITAVDGVEDPVVLDVEIPGSKKAKFCGYSISIGNPHFVVFQNKISYDSNWYNNCGKKISENQVFNAGCNVEFVELVSPRHLRAVVYERGVGLTEACGSGASAIAVAAITLGQAVSPVQIELPGGKLEVSWDGKGEVYLKGAVEEVFEGKIDLTCFEKMTLV